MKMVPSILIIDDEQNVLNSLRRSLKSDEFNIFTTQNPKEVFELLYHHPEIELIMSDFNMPNLNGVELLTEVSQLFPHVTRFIISAYQDFNMIVNAMNDGVVHQFFSKPWDTEDLKRRIKSSLSEKVALKHDGKTEEIAKHEQHTRWFDFLDQLDMAINYGKMPVAVVIVSLENVQSLYLQCGIRKYQESIEILFDRIKEFYENQHLIRILNESTFGIMIPLNDKENENFVIQELTRLYEFLERPIQLANQNIQFIVHCGIAVYPEHGHTAEYLIRNAQEAVYDSMAKDRKIEMYQPHFPSV